MFDFSNIDITDTSPEFWNGSVLATLAGGPQEIDGLSPVTLMISTLTGVDATLGQGGANQSAATLYSRTWSNVKNDVPGFLWKKDGTAATYADFVADGGSVTTTTNANDTINIPTWGYRVKLDPLTGVPLAKLTALAYQFNETRPAPLAVSSASQVGTTVTVVTSASHGIKNGERRHMTGFTPSGYNTVASNGGAVLTVVDPTTFTYQATAGLGAVTVNGTVQALRPCSQRTQTVGSSENPFGDIVQSAASFATMPVNSKSWTNNMALQTGNLFVPYFARVDGRSLAGKRPVGVAGDSLSAWVNDAGTLNPSGSHIKGDAYGSLNFIRRALRAAGYSWFASAVPGTSPATENAYGGNAQRFLNLRGVTVIINGHFHNYATAEAVYANILAGMKTYRGIIRTAFPGVRLVEWTPTPLSSSSNSWVDRAGQSQSAPYNSTGYVYVNWIPYMLGTLNPANGDPDYVIDVNGMFMALDGGSARYQWPANGVAFGYVSDLSHPGSGGHSSVEPAVTAVLPAAIGFST